MASTRQSAVGGRRHGSAHELHRRSCLPGKYVRSVTRRNQAPIVATVFELVTTGPVSLDYASTNTSTRAGSLGAPNSATASGPRILGTRGGASSRRHLHSDIARPNTPASNPGADALSALVRQLEGLSLLNPCPSAGVHSLLFNPCRLPRF